MTRQVPWLRVFVESVVIVGSILLAFGLQAWWEERQERRAEVEYLSALLDETERNLDALAGNVRVWEQSYAALQRAESLVETGLYADSASIFIASLVRGSGSGGPRVSTSVFDELTSSGRLVVIENLDIRRRVLELYAQIEVNLARSARASDAIDAGLYSLVARHLPSGLVQRSGPSISLDENSVGPQEMRSIAESIGSDASLASEIRAEIQERENQRLYTQTYQDRLELARDELTKHMQSRAVR